MNNQAQGGSGGTGGAGGTGGFGGSAYGAGIYNESVGTIWNSVLHHGSALGGTGGSGGSGAGAHDSGFGGGLYVVSALALNNSTIASNAAAGSATDRGGGIFNASTDYLGFTNCTCAGNQADSGGGLYGSASAANTIFAANSAASGPDVQGTATSQDFNLFQITNGLTLIGVTTHNLIGQNPLLGPLQDNGGATLTMALLDGSPALDQGKSFGLTTDQRGAPRPVDFASVANTSGGDGSDIGAFESGRPTLRLQVVGDDAVLSWPGSYGGFTAQSTTNVAVSNSWTSVAGIPMASSNQYLLTNFPVAGSKFFRLKAN